MNCRNLIRDEVQHLERRLKVLAEWQEHMEQQHDHEQCGTCHMIDGYVEGRKLALGHSSTTTP
jgi:hypothetical protein